MTLAWLIAMRGRIDERTGYRRRRGDSRHFDLAWIKRQKGRVFTGGESVTLESPRIKYVRRGPYYPYTPGELARTYLQRLIRQQMPGWPRIMPRFRLSAGDERRLAIPAPLAFLPSRGRDDYFIYVDIGACYFDLFALWPLNAGLNEHTGAVSTPAPALVIPERDRSWLRREKPIRHAMFGMMQSQGMHWYLDGKPGGDKARFLTTYSAPDITALVKLSCHAIAREAVERFDCRMWLTDAGIFTERQALLFQLWLADKWRLGSKPKAWGNGHLYALADYQIGRTASHMAHVELQARDWDNLMAVPAGLAGRRRERLAA